MANFDPRERSSFRSVKGFSRWDRRIGEEFVMGRSVEAVLAAVDRWFPQLSTVNAVTALTRIAKLAVETRSTLGGNLDF